MNSSAPPPSSEPGHGFPNRRRAWLACTTCRARKTRCDAARPKCSLCVAQKVECVYKDSQQIKIDPTAKLLLDRIQMLEDRLFASPILGGQQTSNGSPLPQTHSQDHGADSGHRAQLQDQHFDVNDRPEIEHHIPVPLRHTANANHVLNWPIVAQLLSDVGLGQLPTDATDIFFVTTSDASSDAMPPHSWRLFENENDNVSVQAAPYAGYMAYITAYFDEVGVFFPLISFSATRHIFDEVVKAECDPSDESSTTAPASYCLLLLVLCIGSFVSRGGHGNQFADTETRATQGLRNDEAYLGNMEDILWHKARLLLGYISATITLEAAQCSMLASLYMGAKGRVPDAFHWAHATSVKCATLAKRASISPRQDQAFGEAFRRLYWIAFIYEGDFVSEISITLPSGISLYEDIVPYPVQGTTSKQQMDISTPESEALALAPPLERNDELVAFQISTNAAIRRFLNRVDSVVYDSKDQARINHISHVQWLLRITEDFCAHRDALYRHVPDFLLVSQLCKGNVYSITSPYRHGATNLHELGNNPWNVLRLRGRYYACQYIIHRPFLEYVLLHMDSFHTHPDRGAILDRCRLCLEGCIGFIQVFDVDLANSITCLFATGMATFSYVIVLRLATVCAPFRDILPVEVEHAISGGKRNLRRFSMSINEFEWHLQVLDRLDAACERRTGR